MANKRSRMEMKIAILKLIQKRNQWLMQAPISRLMYGAGVSWVMLTRTLVPEMLKSALITNKTVEYPASVRRYYSLTEKGRDIIRRYDDLCELTDEKPITVPEY